MKVKELIEKLQNLNQDAVVYLSTEGHPILLELVDVEDKGLWNVENNVTLYSE